MGEQVSERESLAMAIADDVRQRRIPEWVGHAPTPADYEVADAALAWFAERVEALLDRYDDPGYGMQEDEWRFVRDLRTLYTTPTTESEGR